MKPYEIDKLVAEKVMGYEIRYGNIVRDGKRSGIPPYSQKIEFAWRVVEKLFKDGMIVDVLSDIQSQNEYKIGYIVKILDSSSNTIARKNESAPLAICLAALKSVGVEVER